MEYEYDSQIISPRNASCPHCNGNESVHFATSLLTVNCQLSTVNWIHTFSAKEKDTETGLSVTSLRSVSSSSLSQAQTSLTWRSLIRRFGSRYYSSDLSIWLSVDPMSDKYPSLSPYTYCANNPIKLVDPNGEEVWIVGSDWESAFNSLQQGTNLELSIKNGVVEIVGGKVLNDNDQQLYDAINDNSVIAKINASDEMPNPDGGKRPFSIQRPNNTTITGETYGPDYGTYS